MEYFFFDGERIKDLAVGDNAEQVVREAIRDLIGLNLYETLGSDMDSLVKKIRRRNIDIPEMQKKIEEKEGEISLIKKKIRNINTQINEKKHGLTELKEKKEIIENKLKRKAGRIAIEKREKEKNLLELNEELKELNDEIRRICDDVLPFLIASDVCENLLKQLKKEKRYC